MKYPSASFSDEDTDGKGRGNARRASRPKFFRGSRLTCCHYNPILAQCGDVIGYNWRNTPILQDYYAISTPNNVDLGCFNMKRQYSQGVSDVKQEKSGFCGYVWTAKSSQHIDITWHIRLRPQNFSLEVDVG